MVLQWVRLHSVRCSPSRGIWWPRMVLYQVILTFGHLMGQADIKSDVSPSRGIWWPRAVPHEVILTFGYPLVQPNIQSDIPPSLRHLMAKNGTMSGHFDICSLEVSGCYPVKHTPLVGVSHGPEWYYIRSS